MLASLGVAGLVGWIGYFPTVRLSGPEAVGAMVVGIAISLVSGCLGAVPICLAGADDPVRTPPAILMATAIRFVAVLALAAPLLLTGWFPRTVLGVWVGISYLAMLAVDSVYAVRVVRRMKGGSS